jgi:hypothetical protein
MLVLHSMLLGTYTIQDDRAVGRIHIVAVCHPQGAVGSARGRDAL